MESFSREETLMLLGMYTLHPRDWELIINHIKDNDDLLPDESHRDVYKNNDIHKLKVRLSTRLQQLLNVPVEEIEDTDVREKVIEVKRMDTRFCKFSGQKETTLTSSSSSDDVHSSVEEELGGENRSSNDVSSCPRRNDMHSSSFKRRHDSSSSSSDGTSNTSKKSKKKKLKKKLKTSKKKSIIDNITNTVGSIFRAALGVTSSSSDSSD